ncbi:MAG: RNA polymerase II holoenzyme cyclin-like subunit [Watsoniomyces obsoletus]|nr:MAG: RNA polymerase II holoenzyme cyclin-like subunit [Watsoniomyces obsoletus]
MAESGHEPSDAAIRTLWQGLDVKNEGFIDAKGLQRGLRKIDHPLKNADQLLREVMSAVDTNRDGRIEYDEFRSFVKQTEKELRLLFDAIDRDGNGKLDKGELRSAFARAGLAVPNSKLDQFFAEVDTNGDGSISFDEWRDFLLFIPVTRPGLRAVLSYYSAVVTLNPEGDVQVGTEAIQGLGIEQFFLLFMSHASCHHPTCTTSPHLIESVWKRLFTTTYPIQLPSTMALQMIDDALQMERSVNSNNNSTNSIPSSSWDLLASMMKSALTTIPESGYFVAGGMAGVVSRTATAPLDRLKVHLIAQTGVSKEAVKAAKEGTVKEATKKASRPLVEASKALWRAGGMRSLFAGNGLNVVKIMPESAIKFGSYEGAKRALAKFEGHGDPKQLTGGSKFLAGGIGGLISHRMQCETVQGGLHGTKLILSTAKKMWITDGLRSFYRGLPMGLIGMFPYAAIDLGTFEYLKRGIATKNARERGCHEEDASPGSIATAGIGAFSGALGASVVYPLNLLRTRLQAQGTQSHPAIYNGIWDVTKKTYYREGVKGLFKGLTPNLLKVVPAVSISYVVYENSKKMLGIP